MVVMLYKLVIDACQGAVFNNASLACTAKLPWDFLIHDELFWSKSVQI